MEFNLHHFFGGVFQVSPDVQEVLDTFRVAAEIGSDSLGAYVISMASNVFPNMATRDLEILYFSSKSLSLKAHSPSLTLIKCGSATCRRVMFLLWSSCKRMHALLLVEN